MKQLLEVLKFIKALSMSNFPSIEVIISKKFNNCGNILHDDSQPADVEMFLNDEMFAYKYYIYRQTCRHSETLVKIILFFRNDLLF